MKTLIVAPSWVGDMVMSQTLFRALKKQQPGMQIDVLAPSWCLDVAGAMPEVSEKIVSPFKHGQLAIKQRMDFGKSLQSKGYDSCYVLPNSLKSALVTFFAKIPKRVGWRGEMRYGLLNDLRVLDKKKYPLMIERFNALAYQEVVQQPLPPKLIVPSTWKESAIPVTGNDVVALCPGAEFGPSKQWPAKYWQQIYDNLKKNYNMMVLGSAKDRDFAAQFAAEGDNLCGQTSLPEAIAILSASKACVTHDSGLMHIAAGLDIPLIAIYGSSSEKFTPPLSNKAHILKANVSCAPCFKRECPLGHHDCMQKLMPAQVIARLEAIL